MLFVIILIIFLRIAYLLYKVNFKKTSRHFITTSKDTKIKTLIFLGSGGHTAEMLTIIKELNLHNYTPRYYLISNNDPISEEKLRVLESNNDEYFVKTISRSRNVNQSFFTSIFTTSYSCVQLIPILFMIKPEIILCNGPGTCVPLCFIQFIYKICFIHNNCKIIFIESYCRVKTLSLSGKILLYFVDEFIVQWPQLKNISKRIKCFGRLF